MRSSIKIRILLVRMREYLIFEADALVRAAYLGLRIIWRFRRPDLPSRLRLTSLIWRNARDEATVAACGRDLSSMDSREGREAVDRAFKTLCDTGLKADMEAQLRESVIEARLPFKNRLLILKAPEGSGKGVLVLSFTHLFPYFLRIFGPSLFEAYHVVLEPSWVGAFTPDWMAFRALPCPVWMQSCEARDNAFLKAHAPNVIAIPEVTANCWTHPGLFAPIPGIPKEYDLAVVSGWAEYKRHYVLFEALRKLRGAPIRVACAGMRMEHDLDYMKELARQFGVAGQVDFYEALSPKDLNVLLNRCRIHALFSRKEGYNRATIESMFAGIPSFVRMGINYGMTYPYTNGISGGFFEEAELPAFLLKAHEGAFASMEPRKWVMENMSPEVSTSRIEIAIFGDDRSRLKRKVNAPEFAYYDPADRAPLEGAYADLKRFLR